MIRVIAVSEAGVSTYTWDIPLARVPLCFNVGNRVMIFEKSNLDLGWSEPLVYLEAPLGDSNSDNQSEGT